MRPTVKIILPSGCAIGHRVARPSGTTLSNCEPYKRITLREGLNKPPLPDILFSPYALFQTLLLRSFVPLDFWSAGGLDFRSIQFTLCSQWKMVGPGNV